MAGLPHHKMALDPALVRIGNVSTNRYKYFRWNKRTVTVNIIFVLVIPSIIGYIGYKTDGKYDLRAKRRGDVIEER
ncbi:hypothetical protein BT67DRAFT_438715 [Trichocladium antarcticum]|uniref:NADH dehydrogenase [ubiquinone] 1 beta subcomplex subunit 4 n=1 Tax=Trichocladium antarcticum TaxID=1450529 RepID=A0AAN6ZGW8_9PEZI|nr:hypothetical protein BT67DRAFT_438715 [Trichocladium antarcticum]